MFELPASLSNLLHQESLQIAKSKARVCSNLMMLRVINFGLIVFLGGYMLLNFRYYPLFVGVTALHLILLIRNHILTETEYLQYKKENKLLTLHPLIHFVLNLVLWFWGSDVFGAMIYAETYLQYLLLTEIGYGSVLGLMGLLGMSYLLRFVLPYTQVSKEKNQTKVQIQTLFQQVPPVFWEMKPDEFLRSVDLFKCDLGEFELGIEPLDHRLVEMAEELSNIYNYHALAVGEEKCYPSSTYFDVTKWKTPVLNFEHATCVLLEDPSVMPFLTLFYEGIQAHEELVRLWLQDYPTFYRWHRQGDFLKKIRHLDKLENEQAVLLDLIERYHIKDDLSMEHYFGSLEYLPSTEPCHTGSTMF